MTTRRQTAQPLVGGEEYPAFLTVGPLIASWEAYRAQGGGEAFAKASRGPAAGIVEELRRAGLRGRGGAGFRTARKWAGAINDPAEPKYICCNGAEGEPGTFKDRFL